MRHGWSVLCLFLSLSAQAEDLRSLLQKPLVLGTEMSASEASPAKRLLQFHTTLQNVKTIARAGARAHEILASAGASAWAGRSVLFALDLFVKDSEDATPGRAVRDLKALVEKASEANLPLVLAEVPKSASGAAQPSRRKINLEITRLCRVPHGCYLVPLAQLEQKIEREKGLRLGDDLVPLAEVYPEGYLMGDALAEYVADGIEEILAK